MKLSSYRKSLVICFCILTVLFSSIIYAAQSQQPTYEGYPINLSVYVTPIIPQVGDTITITAVYNGPAPIWMTHVEEGIYIFDSSGKQINWQWMSWSTAPMINGQPNPCPTNSVWGCVSGMTTHAYDYKFTIPADETPGEYHVYFAVGWGCGASSPSIYRSDFQYQARADFIVVPSGCSGCVCPQSTSTITTTTSQITFTTHTTWTVTNSTNTVAGH